MFVTAFHLCLRTSNFRSNDPNRAVSNVFRILMENNRQVCVKSNELYLFGTRVYFGRKKDTAIRHMDGKRSVNERALHACYRIVNQVAHLRLKSERVDVAGRCLKRQRASKRIAIVYSGRVRHKCFNSNPVGIWTYR